jgi:hypothetical protein
MVVLKTESRTDPNRLSAIEPFIHALFHYVPGITADAILD